MRVKHEFYVDDYVFYVDNDEVTGGLVSKLITNNTTKSVAYVINGHVFTEDKLYATRAKADDELIKQLQIKANRLTEELLSRTPVCKYQTLNAIKSNNTLTKSTATKSSVNKHFSVQEVSK